MAAYTGAAVASAAASVYRTRLPNIITTSSLPLFSRHSISLPSPSSQVFSIAYESIFLIRETSSSVQVEDLCRFEREVFIYGGGALVAVWLSSIIAGAINSVPLLPKIMELVGLGYTGWFVYRYLLFKSSRKELVSDIESLKKKFARSGLLDQENS